MEYYKKIDKSFFKYGITIPKDHVSSFCDNELIPPSGSKDVLIIWNKKKYNAKIYHVNRKKASSVHQLRWDNNQELLRELKYEFIQSYFAIESGEITAKENDTYYITNLLGGNQEVVIFHPRGNNIELETFIRITTPYDNIFKRFIENNVFGWMSKLDKEQLITKRTNWIDLKDLRLHEKNTYVVYYLIDELNKQIYIGSATTLGDRVKIGRHEIPGWNKFRYEIVHPNYHNILREIEYHAIMAFARFLKNSGNLSSINISEYVLVNKDYKYYTS